MKDSLTYRISDDGETNFNAAVNTAKKWIAANINGPLKLTFGISLKAVAADGASVETAQETENLPLKERSENEPDLSRYCAGRKHKKCTYEKCECACHQVGLDA